MGKPILSKIMRDEVNRKKEKVEGSNYKACLDHGFVRLIDSMGNDAAIDEAARLSYGTGTRKTSEIKGLVKYLMRHKHTSPFEMVEFKFHCKMPIFVARQWVRHRTASINEYSARYSIMTEDFYLPVREDMAVQSTTNNQGRGERVDDEEYPEYIATIRATCDNAYQRYEFLLNDKTYKNHNPKRNGLARELARMILPVNFYTEWYWKCDLHNIFHLLKLRTDPHAQKEIRVFADSMFELIKPIVPIACEAFEDYNLKAVTFSSQEMELIKMYICMEEFEDEKHFELSKRELQEFKEKLGF
jgi:thymidylate synthase (FAD)